MYYLSGKKNKIVSLILTSVLFLFLFTSCAAEGHGKEGIVITASLFPQYDFAKKIAGDKMKVNLLLPPGSESHSFEPSPKDMTNVAESDMFIYTGDEMEPWAGRIISGFDKDKINAVNLSEKIGITIQAHNHDEEDEDHDEADDAHIWLSPDYALKMIYIIADEIILLDPGNAVYYTKNRDEYVSRLKEIYAQYDDALKNAKRNTIVFGGRFAFSNFTRYYGLEYVSVFSSCAAEAEPSINDVARVIDYIEDNGVPVIFYEELADPKVARSISEETGAKMMMFSTAHNITKKEFEDSVGFDDILIANLESLKAAVE